MSLTDRPSSSPTVCPTQLPASSIRSGATSDGGRKNVECDFLGLSLLAVPISTSVTYFSHISFTTNLAIRQHTNLSTEIWIGIGVGIGIVIRIGICQQKWIDVLQPCVTCYTHLMMAMVMDTDSYTYMHKWSRHKCIQRSKGQKKVTICVLIPYYSWKSIWKWFKWEGKNRPNYYAKKCHKTEKILSFKGWIEESLEKRIVRNIDIIRFDTLRITLFFNYTNFV